MRVRRKFLTDEEERSFDNHMKTHFYYVYFVKLYGDGDDVDNEDNDQELTNKKSIVLISKKRVKNKEKSEIGDHSKT